MFWPKTRWPGACTSGAALTHCWWCYRKSCNLRSDSLLRSMNGLTLNYSSGQGASVLTTNEHICCPTLQRLQELRADFPRLCIGHCLVELRRRKQVREIGKNA